jgi:tRNA U34 5-methylaminomethyl-2-thiouridine-forming methyltransferase MnmC
MERELRITEDGSHTIFVSSLDEPYHSIHGALQESEHVFINQGFKSIATTYIRILEIGFGTGLNIALTLAESNRERSIVDYHAIEKYPLDYQEYTKLNFWKKIDAVTHEEFLEIHNSPWGKKIDLNDHFTLHKEQSDFRTMNPEGLFDLVYFDAFDPQKQPYLWSEEVFSHISEHVKTGGILVTYSAKGSVRRALKVCGFVVEKVPGPPGKREMIKAVRI